MKIHTTLLSVLILLSALSLRAQNFGANTNLATNPPDFQKLSYEEASKAVNSEVTLIATERAKKIAPEYFTNLVNQVRMAQISKDNKVLAIYLLGALQPNDTNSIEVLIENIDFKASRFDPKWSLPRWAEYPAQDALIRIGTPSVKPILNHLKNETNQIRRNLMCEVLRRVEGGEIAQDQIKQQLMVETDSASKSHLEAALKELEK